MKYLIPGIICSLLFLNCVNTSSKNKGTEQEKPIDYIEQGQKIAQTTFSTLSSNLQGAMQEGGVTNAVQYCNLAASPLVDSLENEYQVEIKRTALKVRNPKNLPTKEEKAVLEKYQEQLDVGKEVKPIIRKNDNQTVFHAPIFLMPLCQKCHGTVGEQLLEEDYAVIQDLYPSDKAISYKSGDLRGMWSITFYEPK